MRRWGQRLLRTRAVSRLDFRLFPLLQGMARKEKTSLHTRRSALLGILGTVMAGPLARDVQAAGSSLAGIAGKKGLVFGSAVRARQLASEPALRQAILHDCSIITPEVELKWDAVEPLRGQLSLTGIDDIAKFALDNGKTVRGHTLLWHRSIPAWAAQSLREQRDWRLISRYFASVLPRYGDVIHQWDVVNEPIETGYRTDGLRGNAFLEAFGPDYIRRALVEARVFAPNAKLMLNEFSLEYDSQVERDRRYLLLKLVERLKHAGAPLDGVGLQGHLDLRKGTISTSSIAEFLKELANMGLDIVVTELDVKESDYAAPADVRDRLVADEVRRYLDAVLAQRAVSGVLTWGLSDRQSWLEVLGEDYGRFPNAWTKGDGPGLNRGLPYDASMRPKSMYRAIAAAFLAR
jgi:endo-1,4-beta-xylanase